MRRILGLLVWSLSVLNLCAHTAWAAAQNDSDEPAVVKNGSIVSLEYTLSGENGAVIESSEGKPPLKYTHGQRQIIPGLERELAGMKTGEQKSIKVKPEDAYGMVDPKAFREVPRDKLPPEALKVGAGLTARTPDGKTIAVRVHEIKENTVVLDFNHPLAGKTLTFDVKITEIQPGETK